MYRSYIHWYASELSLLSSILKAPMERCGIAGPFQTSSSIPTRGLDLLVGDLLLLGESMSENHCRITMKEV